MELFRKRRLSLILCIMLVSFSFFVRIDMILGLSLCAISLFVFLAFFFFKKALGSKAGILTAVTLAVLISSTLGILWQTGFYPREYYEKEVFIKGRLIDADHTEPSQSNLIIDAYEINGKACSYKIQISGSKDELSGTTPGDVVSLVATVKSIEDSSLGFGEASFYISDGISATSTQPSNLYIIEHTDTTGEEFFDKCRVFLGNRLKENTNFETGALLSALITGDRSDLDPNTALNFKRIGITHTLALSGMHLAILTSLIFKFLSIFRLNKKIKALATILFTISYMLLTGFSSSVTRAGLMLLIYYGLFLTSRTNDGITSLSISVFILFLVQPHSAFDISLFLSALATFGLLFFSELTGKKRESRNTSPILLRAVKAILQSFLSTVFAITACFLITASSFNEVSAVSLFTTMLFSILIELLIIGGIICLLVGWFIPISYLLIPLSNFTRYLADLISSLPYAQTHAGFTAVRILSILTIITFLFLILFGKRRWKTASFSLLSAMLCSVFTLSIVLSANVRAEEDFAYYTDVGTDLFFVKSQSEVTILLSGVESDTAREVVNILDSEQITYLDKLVFADYNESTHKVVYETVSERKVKTVFLPAPNTSAELSQAEHCADYLSKYGTEMQFYYDDNVIRMGEHFFAPIERAYFTPDNNTPASVFVLRIYDKIYSFFSAGACTADSMKKAALITGSDALILGTKGNDNTYFDVLSEEAKAIIMGCEYTFSEYARDYYNRVNAHISIVKVKEDLLENARHLGGN